jgi:hypothetical protein
VRLPVLLCLLVALVAGCGSADGPTAAPTPSSSSSSTPSPTQSTELTLAPVVTATPAPPVLQRASGRALAAIALDHLADVRVVRREGGWRGGGALFVATLRGGPGTEVYVETTPPERSGAVSCARVGRWSRDSGYDLRWCEEGEGRTLELRWPEDGGAMLFASLHSDAGDVDVMVDHVTDLRAAERIADAIVRDPRLGWETTAETVEAGARVEGYSELLLDLP